MTICTDDLVFKKGQDEGMTRAQNAIKRTIDEACAWVVERKKAGCVVSTFDDWLFWMERLACPLRCKGCGRQTAPFVAEIVKKWGIELDCPCNNKYCPLSSR